MTDTSYLETAAREFDDYARQLHGHSSTLSAHTTTSWRSTSGDTFRDILGQAGRLLTTLAETAEEAARATRQHAEAVAANPVSETLNATLGATSPLASWATEGW